MVPQIIKDIRYGYKINDVIEKNKVLADVFYNRLTHFTYALREDYKRDLKRLQTGNESHSHNFLYQINNAIELCILLNWDRYKSQFESLKNEIEYAFAAKEVIKKKEYFLKEGDSLLRMLHFGVEDYWNRKEKLINLE